MNPAEIILNIVIPFLSAMVGGLVVAIAAMPKYKDSPGNAGKHPGTR